mmetsp:Transcript_15943/g.24142  ORF Transcript_15943/g.24142 Transcript_15943/m.24142 type:complete len:110 (-) Transcript_15943:160-489(-)
MLDCRVGSKVCVDASVGADDGKFVGRIGDGDGPIEGKCIAFIVAGGDKDESLVATLDGSVEGELLDILVGQAVTMPRAITVNASTILPIIQRWLRRNHGLGLATQSAVS